MAVIGVLLIVIALLVAGAALWAGLQPGVQAPQVDFLGGSYSLHPVTMLAIGAGAVLLLLLGLWFMTSAGKRRWRDHRERRDLEKRQREQEKELAKTRAELARKEGTTTGTPATAGHVGTEREVVREDVRREDDRGHLGRDRTAERVDERVEERRVVEEPLGHREATGPRPDDTFDDGRGAHDTRGSGMHSGGTLSREEEVRRAAERRRDGV